MTSPDCNSLNVPLRVAVATVTAQIILGASKVRIHTRISRYPWARLWYLCRGFDGEGRGAINLPLEVVKLLLECSDKSIYRWLSEGRKVGAFRYYRVRSGWLKVYLGSLYQVCWHLNLRNWGGVGECPLFEVNEHIRELTTGIVTQKLQQSSRYAANCKLKSDYRVNFGAPHPNELLGDGGQSSLKSAVGQVPFVLHISESRVFVSKSFTHFGTSQNAIARELMVHPRTVRRHQQAITMKRRQLCQAKYEYAQLQYAYKYEASECWAWSSDGTRDNSIGYQVTGDVVKFSDGITPGAKKSQPNSYQIPTGEFSNRIFRMGDKYWISRCNIYREQFTLKAMSAARRKFKHQLSHVPLSKFSGGGVLPELLKIPAPTGI